MVKHTQTICVEQSTNCLSLFDHFVGLALIELKLTRLLPMLHYITPENIRKPYDDRQMYGFVFSPWTNVTLTELEIKF